MDQVGCRPESDPGPSLAESGGVVWGWHRSFLSALSLLHRVVEFYLCLRTNSLVFYGSIFFSFRAEFLYCICYGP